jgi:hypothetical protein
LQGKGEYLRDELIEIHSKQIAAFFNIIKNYIKMVRIQQQ